MTFTSHLGPMNVNCCLHCTTCLRECDTLHVRLTALFQGCQLSTVLCNMTVLVLILSVITLI